MKNAIKQLHYVLPANSFKTATVDRVKEFACYANIEKYINLPVLFADNYSSLRRSSREFYTKKTDLTKVN